jgi:hypothetical protein
VSFEAFQSANPVTAELAVPEGGGGVVVPPPVIPAREISFERGLSSPPLQAVTVT